MYGPGYKLEKWKEKTHDLNHDLTFSAHTMFRVLCIYNFGFNMKIEKNAILDGFSNKISNKKEKDKAPFWSVECPNWNANLVWTLKYPGSGEKFSVSMNSGPKNEMN